jgi:hypothetical protein
MNVHDSNTSQITEAASSDSQQKESWETPIVRSLETPGIEGGTLTYTNEALHGGGSTRGQRS